MSLIKTGFGIAALSGKLGGTIYARNRGGMYARAFTNPATPFSPDQTNKWQIWTDSAAAFQTLTGEELDRWHTYTGQLTRLNRLGEPIRLTAQQIFTECYTNATLVGATPITIPTAFTDKPAITNSGTLEAVSDSTTLTRLRLTGCLAICPSDDIGRVIVYSSPILRPSVRNVNNQFRMIFVADADGDPMKLDPDYITKFGDAATPGQIAHLRLRVIDGISMLGSTRVLINATVIT